MEEKSTKILMPTIVAVVTLIVLVVGATYAYFTVGATNNFETRTIEASADIAERVAIREQSLMEKLHALFGEEEKR